MTGPQLNPVKPMQENPSALSGPGLPLPRAKVLIVDDEPANLMALEALLDGLGQELVRANSGEEALRRLLGQDFAVILLDVRMEGMDGFETAKQIRGRERSRQTPIIFLTARAGDDFPVSEAYSLGAVDYLVKPLVSEVVRAKVAALVELFEQKEQARRQAELLRLLIQGAGDYAIFMLDPQGRVATWNAAAERIIGYRAEEIVGEHCSRFHPQEAIERGWPAAELRRAAAAGRFEDEGWRLRKDGTHFWANVVIAPLRDPEGRLLGFSKISRDRTDRKRAEEELRNHRDRLAQANEILHAEIAERQRAEQKLRQTAEDLARSNRDLEQFAYVASHDLQEPIRMVSLYVQLLHRHYRVSFDDRAQQYITRVIEGARHMRTLIKDLLTYARAGSVTGDVNTVESATAFDRAVAHLAGTISESGAEVTRGSLPAVRGDGTQLVQLFQNLIGNAIKFRADRAPRVRVEAARDGNCWRFSVCDNGIGIDARYHDRLFVIFQRLHGRDQYPGTGIGLAICKRIVERLGGRIWLESRPGQGTSFFFTLPTVGGS
jgi:PAS domain S-box-containing protein